MAANHPQQQLVRLYLHHPGRGTLEAAGGDGPIINLNDVSKPETMCFRNRSTLVLEDRILAPVAGESGSLGVLEWQLPPTLRRLGQGLSGSATAFASAMASLHKHRSRELAQLTQRLGEIAALLPTEERRTEARSAAAAEHLRPCTTLIAEPDAADRRELTRLLGELGHRVVPVSNAEEAADLADRLKFDIVFCAVRLEGMSWVDLAERVRGRVAVFTLLTGDTDSGLEGVFPEHHLLLLRKPVTLASLRNCLGRAAVYLGETAPPGPA